jgi:hypothetical protein
MTRRVLFSTVTGRPTIVITDNGVTVIRIFIITAGSDAPVVAGFFVVFTILLRVHTRMHTTVFTIMALGGRSCERLGR